MSAFPQFITDPGVEQCGSLSMTLDPSPHNDGDDSDRNEEDFQHLYPSETRSPREIQARMLFGDTEIRAAAVDVSTGAAVRASVDFMSESNPKYVTKM